MSAEVFAYSNIGDFADPFMMIFVIVYGIILLIALAYSVTVYILQSLGMYTIAKRRGIHHPGLAWVPVANMWILGSISDQYQYVVKGKIRNRRKTLLGLIIALEIVAILFLVGFFVMMFGIVDAEMSGVGVGMEIALPMILFMIGYLVLVVLAIVASVFQYIACYDLFNSCNPGNAVLFLVLGIIFNFLMPFFIFACRKKDEGMPPRRIQVPVAPWQPAPTHFVPQAPWQPPVVQTSAPNEMEDASEPVAEEAPAQTDTTEE